MRFLLVFSDFDPGLDPNIGSDLRIRLCKCSFYIANLSIVTFFHKFDKKKFDHRKFYIEKDRFEIKSCTLFEGPG